MPNHISACGPGVQGSEDLAAHHTTGFEHLAQEKYFASPGGLPSSTICETLVERARDEQQNRGTIGAIIGRVVIGNWRQ